ncbi:lipopolysaccharide kinase InaA family protein [Sansalvadorimonas verongulae]|uniref:lipopolysaccharide kinase InaA family protein n=1 Tax=Sansalvadorimonas verongulae TaxID=2172824 RepID=UPI0012BD506A|nr:lipopolysaccharide kinase InaA family protein [Sansalvadorimonas verongulae]MTI15291.1 heptose kinase [Sansalvadorimonas verongulae]
MIGNLLRKVRWTVAPQYRGTPIGDNFSTLDKVFSLPILEGIVSGDTESTVFRYQQDGVTFYVKRYHATKGLRSWLGRSRLRGEWNNLKLFKQLDIPAARLAAYGEERFLTYAGRGALITEALPNTRDLSDLAHSKDPCFQNRQWVQKVIAQVADSARKMHNDGFAHNDFKWRNVLVNDDIDNPGVFLIDCPAGQHWFGPFLRYRIIKDLACLDKMGKYHLSRTQRLHFFKLYRRTDKKLTSQDKKMIRRIVKFFEGRE